MRARAAALALIAALALVAVSCDTTTPDSPEGPTISVASFNFGESVVLAEIYAQLLASHGYPVETKLNLGSRELVYPEFTSSGIDLLPEYVGSALAVGFGGVPTADVEATIAALNDEAAALNATFLNAAPGQDQNVYVVSPEYSAEHGLTAISDLAALDNVVVSGPAECETRTTCLVGLRDVYELDNLEFRVEQEVATRVASLQSGLVDMTVLFSTLPIFAQADLVVLDDDRGITPAENIVPLVSNAAIDAHGADLTDLLNQVTALLTTDVLIDLNVRVEVDAENPDDVAAAFLATTGLLGAAETS